jgi:hypothetical protein
MVPTLSLERKVSLSKTESAFAVKHFVPLSFPWLRAKKVQRVPAVH